MKQKTIALKMTTETLLAYLATRPIPICEGQEDSKEKEEVAIAMCHTLLKHVQTVSDESQRIGIMAVVYIVARVMDLKEIPNDELLTLWLSQEDGEFKELLSLEATKHIRELAQEDYQYYIHWISPFLLKAGVVDINSELEEIDVIQKMLCGVAS